MKQKKQEQEIVQKEEKFLFLKFMIRKSQMLDFAIISVCCLLAYTGIRYCYPYPMTMVDSGGYVDAIVQNIFYVYRPWGYSWFLKTLHAVTPSIHAIFIVQLLLLFLATYFLALTVKYFYAPAKKWLWYASLLFLIFTPTLFVMANWIMSDLLFSVQIYFIVALFIFIIKRESWVAAVLYVLILFTALHVRYSAMVIPFVMIPFFIMKKGKLRWVITLLSVLAFSVFYFQIKNSMKERVQIEQFSTGFDGWVYANNVLYVLPHIDLKTSDLKSQKLKDLHNFLMEDIDIIEKVAKERPINASFMWNNKLQFKQYIAKTINEQKSQYLQEFVRLGSGVYKDYAIHIMTHYPVSYLRYYYLPNLAQTFYPDAGCLARVDPAKIKVIDEYYNIDTENKMQAKHHVTSNPKYNSAIKILHLIMWIAIIGIAIAAFSRRKKIVFSKEDKIVFWGLFGFAVIYYASSIFAAPMEARYTISMHSIRFIFCYMLLNKLLGEKNNNEIKTTAKQPLKDAAWKKTLFPFKYAPAVYLAVISIVVVICAYFIYPDKSRNDLQSTQIKTFEKSKDSRTKEYIEACEFFKSLPDSILVVTRKPEIFTHYSDGKKAVGFPYNGSPDTIMSYLKEIKATHIILDDRFRYAYLTLYPAVQANPEKFKVLKEIGKADTVAKRNPTYLVEFNEEWGYYGERVDGQKTGEGYELLQDGRKYVGHFENNNFNGFGTLYDKDGKELFRGEWRNGTIIKGEGELTYTDGKKYIGQFTNNMPDGRGALYAPDGKLIAKGRWRDGMLVGAD